MEDKIIKKEELNLITASLIQASHYCRRLAYLQFVHQEWRDTADTIEGRRVHKRIDKKTGFLPSPEELKNKEAPFQTCSVTLSSERLGLIAKMDLLETDGSSVIPVEYKKGKQPCLNRIDLESDELPKNIFLKGDRSDSESSNQSGNKIFLPEEIQLCVQAMVLRDNGYSCEKGMTYYAGNKKRVSVHFTKELFAQTDQVIKNLREDIEKTKAPDPLKDSSKCPRCSLVEICLPDEFHLLKKNKKNVRPISIKSDRQFPVYVQSYRGKVSKKDYRLEIKIDDENKKFVPIMDVSQLVLMGNVSITTPCLHELMRREIPVTWHSYGGWFLGHAHGVGHKNVALRLAQYRKSFNSEFCLSFAKSLIKAKIYNCRTILRRNWRLESKPVFLLMSLKQYAEKADKAKDFQELLGIEGYAARIYFQHFNRLIKDNEHFPFMFNKRNRRPPEDPVNLLLSFSYAMLTRLWTVTLSAIGFDPFCGFYHKSRYGRPSLALDMMEPFRPLICDSSVLLAINNGEVQSNQFVHSGGKVGWTEKSRKSFISVFERRLRQKVTHPVFQYELSYRQLLEAQARLFARYLFDEIESYPNFMTR